MKRKTFFILILAIAVFGTAIFAFNNIKSHLGAGQIEAQATSEDNSEVADVEAPAATPVPASAEDINNTSHDISALGGYDVLIADRGNNRIIEVTPDKKIVWEYHFNLPKLGLGADDAFFTDNGKSIIVNLEEYHIIQLIDYASKKVTWSYGMPGKPGDAAGMLNTPDDAYKLANGNVIVADIKNCRVIEISPEKQIVNQYGKTKKCGNSSSLLNKPNGDTPLPDGHILISNIVGKNLVELDSNWQQIFTMPLPVNYPSDPQQTKAENILISDYSKPGNIVEVSKQGNVVWQFDGQAGDVKLDHPSLAIELPNGNILSNDDLNHRVIVVDKQMKKIIWQYGVTGKPGSGPSQLNIPDGVDIIKRDQTVVSSVSTPVPSGLVLKIGQVSRHPQNYVNKSVTVTGYLLKQRKGYAIFSDEAVGAIGPFDLPASGLNVNNLLVKQKYTLEGILKYKGLTASNHNLYHLELTNIFNQ
jgi:hypothetical protein